LQELIEIKDKLVPTECPSMGFSMTKPMGEEMSQIFIIHTLTLKFSIFLKLLPLTIYQTMIGGSQLLSYVMVGNELFKKMVEGVLLRCLNENEASVAISSVHSGACGSHQAGHKMKWLMLRQGLYWPSMLKDCIEFAKGCQECLKHNGFWLGFFIAEYFSEFVLWFFPRYYRVFHVKYWCSFFLSLPLRCKIQSLLDFGIFIYTLVKLLELNKWRNLSQFI
jgi:hypothetical protein